jgi:hypothetical protein
MNKSKRRAVARALALGVVIAGCGALAPLRFAGAAGEYTAEKFSAAPPAEVSAAIREVLSNDGIRVQGPKGPLCEIWLRRAIPLNANPSNELGIAFPEFAEGTLAAVVRFPAEVTDYRQQHVKSGVYTLRYALNPVNGNHQGVAPQRDFLLASPAAGDAGAAALSMNDLLALSRKAAGRDHPSVWSLSPVEGQPATLPAMSHQEDGDLWLAEFPVHLQAANNTVTVKTVGLVVVGHAPEA